MPNKSKGKKEIKKPSAEHPWRKRIVGTAFDHDKLSWFRKNRLKINRKYKGYTAGSNTRYET